MRYYIWIDETNKVWTRPKPFEVCNLHDIFMESGGGKYRGMRIALAIGSREYLEQTYELRGDAFKGQENSDEQ